MRPVVLGIIESLIFGKILLVIFRENEFLLKLGA